MSYYDPLYISVKQRAVLDLLATGLTTRAIAGRLGLPYSTVNQRISALMRRRRVSSRVGLVISALQVGWLRLEEIRLEHWREVG